jgi:hypothetical protein
MQRANGLSTDSLAVLKPAAGRRILNPLLDTAREAVLLDYLRLRANRPENQTAAERFARRGIRAWQLAPTPAIYEALMAGETVPIAKLNPEAVQRYGLK